MRPAKPERAPWVTPYITAKDLERSSAFYQDAFNFQNLDSHVDETGVMTHLEMQYQNHLIMFGKEGAWESHLKTPASSGVDCPITLYLYTENVDDFYHSATAKGAISVMEPADMFWGDRMCALKDPDGYVWSFATNIADHG